MPEIDPDLQEHYDYNKQYAHKGPYETDLEPADEKKYKKWVSDVSKMLGRSLNPDDPSYDMRGFFKYNIMLGGKFSFGEQGHFPDTFKTPYHPTFSRESMYAKPDAPFWKDDTLVDPKTNNPTPGFLSEILRGR
jgi:hypothetical protein